MHTLLQRLLHRLQDDQQNLLSSLLRRSDKFLLRMFQAEETLLERHRLLFRRLLRNQAFFKILLLPQYHLLEFLNAESLLNMFLNPFAHLLIYKEISHPTFTVLHYKQIIVLHLPIQESLPALQ